MVGGLRRRLQFSESTLCSMSSTTENVENIYLANAVGQKYKYIKTSWHSVYVVTIIT